MRATVTTREASNTRPPKLFVWAIVAAGAFILAASVVPVIAIWQSGSWRKDPGWRARSRSHSWVVTQVEASGPADGSLQTGDRLLAIDGDTRAGRIGPEFYLWEKPAGAAYRITVERSGSSQSFVLTQRAIHDSDALYLSIAELLEAYAFFFNGVLIAGLRSQDRIARLAVFNSALCSVYILALASNIESGMLSPLLRNLALVLYMVAPFHWLGGYIFYSAFPFETRKSPIWRLLAGILLVGGVLLWFPLTFSRVLLMLPGETARKFAAGFPSLADWLNERSHAAFTFYILACITAILAVVWRNYRSLPEGDMRRRIRWVAWGALVGLLPVMTSNLVQSFLHASPIARQFEVGLFVANRLADLMAMIIPITIAYAVIKHRVLGVGVAVRLGLQYLLAKNVLRAILLLPLAALVFTIATNPNTTVSQLFFGDSGWNSALIVIGLALLRYRARLTAYLDRRFFRESYRQEQILVDLAESVKNLGTIPEISRLLAAQIVQSLHPRSLHLFFRQEQHTNFSLMHTGAGAADLQLDASAKLILLLETRRASITDSEWRASFDAEEVRWLDALGARLAVPLLGTEHRLLGILLLGEKRSEEPYIQKDRSLLEAASIQAGIVFENLVLRERASRQRQMQAYIEAKLQEHHLNLLRECPKCGGCYDSQASICDADQTELTGRMPIERVIQGKYRLDRVIGRGGMGTVYQALDLRLSRKVAVKVMSSSLFGNSMAFRRFVREAHACARLHHPNIAGIHDFGELEGGGAFLTLEYVPGSSLRREMARYYAQPENIISLLTQVLDAIEAAHSAGIVHRDLKPENILLTPVQLTLVAKVVDFGLAKIRELELTDPYNRTSAGAIFGTPGYMAPEQHSGLEADHRADIYALGIITLELLGGKIRFRQMLPYLYVEDALSEFFSALEPSPGWEALRRTLRRAVTIEPAERFPTVRDLRAALIPALALSPPLVRLQPGSLGTAKTLVAEAT